VGPRFRGTTPLVTVVMVNHAPPPPHAAFGLSSPGRFDLDNTLYSTAHTSSPWEQVTGASATTIAELSLAGRQGGRRPATEDSYKKALTAPRARADDRSTHEVPTTSLPSSISAQSIHSAPLPADPGARRRDRDAARAAKLILNIGTVAMPTRCLARLGLDPAFRRVFDIVAAELEPNRGADYTASSSRPSVDARKAASSGSVPHLAVPPASA